jgi:hypothetical protein
MRRRLLALAALSLSCFGVAACTLPNQTKLATDAADPDVTWDGHQYVLHTTNTSFGNVPTYTSPDLATWTFAGDALPHLPAWADPGWTWAPSSIRRADGKWFLYFSAAVHGRTTSGGQPLKCLGVASAPTATGPFTVVKERNAAPLLCDPAFGGDIDPAAYQQNSASNTYLVSKLDGNSIARPTAIQNHRLDPSLWSFAAGMGPTTLLWSTIGTWEAQNIEGPDLLFSGGRLHLVYSAGDFAQPTYGEGQALCAATNQACIRNGRLLDAALYGTGAAGASGFTSSLGAPLLAWHAYNGGTTRILLIGTLATAPDGVLSVTGSPQPGARPNAVPQQRAGGLPSVVQLTVPGNQPVTVPNAHQR